MISHPSTCTGVLASIQAEPSYSFWFNMQLVVYGLFLLFAVWVIGQEEVEKRYVCTALRLGGLLDEEEEDDHSHRGWQRWRRTVVPGVLLPLLGVLYAVCLLWDNVREDFLLSRYRGMLTTQDVQDIQRLLSSPWPLLVWYCEALTDGRIVHVTYSLRGGVNPFIAVVQGVYFMYNCYTLLKDQWAIYDFIDPDIYMTYHFKPEAIDSDCSYAAIVTDIRNTGRVVTMAQVDHHLHVIIDLPFLRHVHRLRPDLIPSFFNHHEAQLLLTMIEQGDNDKEDEQDEKDEKEERESKGMEIGPGLHISSPRSLRRRFSSFTATTTTTSSSSSKLHLDQHLNVTVYLPFLQQLHQRCSDAIERLFDEEEADHLISSLVGYGGGEPGDSIGSDNSLYKKEEKKGEEGKGE